MTLSGRTGSSPTRNQKPEPAAFLSPALTRPRRQPSTQHQKRRKARQKSSSKGVQVCIELDDQLKPTDIWQSISSSFLFGPRTLLTSSSKATLSSSPTLLVIDIHFFSLLVLFFFIHWSPS